MMVADELYDGKPWIDLSELKPKKGLKQFAGVDVQETSGVDFFHQIFRVLKMDASVPVDSRVFMQNVPCENTLLTAGSRTWSSPVVGSTRGSIARCW